MYRRFLAKLRRGPLDVVKRVVEKTIVGRLRYGRSDGDYDAARYWSDRLSSRGTSLRGVGDEGLSEEENRREYEQSAAIFRSLCSELNVFDGSPRVLEVGPGAGFYTRLLAQLSVRDYLGLDITDALFGDLRSEFPAFRFEQRDITADPVQGTFDVVVMIDVIEHIVTDERMSQCMRTIDGALKPGGLFVLAPVMPRARKHLYYVRLWSVSELERRLPGYTRAGAAPFRDGDLVVYRKPGSGAPR